MTKQFTDWMNEGFVGNDYSQITKRLKMSSGLTLSVQAGWSHYCQPRTNELDYNAYDEFEIGFPSEKVESLMSYAEDRDNPTGTVYGYVPKALIESIVEQHGGAVGFEEI